MTIKKAYVDGRDGQIHYLYDSRNRPGQPALVMLHKSASSARSYQPLMAELAPQYAVYALDTPGFGQSYDPESPADSGYYANALLEAIAAIGLPAFHLIGHHTGACFAGEMAVISPHRVQSLTLMGPAVLTPDERAALRLRYSAPFNRPVADGSHLAKTWDYLRAMGCGDSLALHQREAIDHARAWRGREQAYHTIWDQDFSAIYLRIACPILLMCATDDVLWPYFARAQAMRPDAHSAIITGANFSPDLDPGAAAQAVRRFLGPPARPVAQRRPAP